MHPSGPSTIINKPSRVAAPALGDPRLNERYKTGIVMRQSTIPTMDPIEVMSMGRLLDGMYTAAWP
jgi:hypothetical protein